MRNILIFEKDELKMGDKKNKHKVKQKINFKSNS